jgi:predicted transcriptional regulator
METLAKLFGSETKVKILRLFLFNPDQVFDAHDVSARVQSELPKVRRELLQAEKMGLVRRRATSKKRKTGHGYVLDAQFTYLSQLQNFLINIEPLLPKEIIKKFTRLGSIKLILVAGVFIQSPESRVDLLIVGDGIKANGLQNTIKNIEAEIGRELRYTYFTTEDFKYRLSMYDKLTRDILDYPHKKILNKLTIV